MVAVIATLLLTWFIVGMVGSFLCETTLRESLVGGGTIGFMLIVGWFPASIVGMDLSGINGESRN